MIDMDEVPSTEQSIFTSPVLYFRFFILGVFLIGLGLFINKVPNLSPPKLELVESTVGNQSTVASDKKEGSTLGSNSTTVSNLININSASQTELEALPGVGPKTAIKIIDNRPYAAIADLVSKDVISFKLFDQIKKQITL